MPRRSAAIKQVYPRDMVVFRMLFNVQHCERELLKIPDNRLKTMENQKLIARCRNLDNQEIICLTNKGRDYIAKLPEFSGRKPYVASTAAKHNCELARIYASLSPEQQNRWITEKEIADRFEEQMEYLREHDFDRWCEFQNREWSACDGGLANENGEGEGEIEQLFEVVTDNYGDLDIKIICSQVLNCSIEFHKV